MTTRLFALLPSFGGGIRLLTALFALTFSAAAAAQGYLAKLRDDFNDVKALSKRTQRFEFVPGSWQPLFYLDLAPYFQFGLGSL